MRANVWPTDSRLPMSRFAHNSNLREEGHLLALSGKRAVIVEDQGVTQLQLQRILRSEGVEIVGVASNGLDAVEVVLGTRPDLVLMDTQMPEMDGIEASRRILSEYSVCIIMLTAYLEEEYQEAAKEAGACGYAVKPVTAATLLPQIVAALNIFDQK